MQRLGWKQLTTVPWALWRVQKEGLRIESNAAKAQGNKNGRRPLCHGDFTDIAP